MNTIKTTVRNRRIDLPAPSELPDGTEVLIEVTPVPLRQSIPISIWDGVNAFRDKLATSGRHFGDSTELVREDRER